jgi:hypothetical protein
MHTRTALPCLVTLCFFVVVVYLAQQMEPKTTTTTYYYAVDAFECDSDHQPLLSPTTNRLVSLATTTSSIKAKTEARQPVVHHSQGHHPIRICVVPTNETIDSVFSLAGLDSFRSSNNSNNGRGDTIFTTTTEQVLLPSGGQVVGAQTQQWTSLVCSEQTNRAFCAWRLLLYYSSSSS